jgi:hypothetical protein
MPERARLRRSGVTGLSAYESCRRLRSNASTLCAKGNFSFEKREGRRLGANEPRGKMRNRVVALRRCFSFSISEALKQPET